MDDQHQYSVGPITYAKVFQAAGLTNMSNMQAVLDAVERALADSVGPKPSDAQILTAMGARPAGIYTFVIRNILAQEHGFPGLRTPAVRRQLHRLARAGKVAVHCHGPGCHSEWRIVGKASA